MQMIGDGSDVKHIVFLVSDFRTKDWSHAAETAQNCLQKLNEAGAKVQLINCVDEARPNLAITALKPAPGHSSGERAAADGSDRAEL